MAAKKQQPVRKKRLHYVRGTNTVVIRAVHHPAKGRVRKVWIESDSGRVWSSKEVELR